MIKFKDINYPRRKEKEIIINLPNEYVHRLVAKAFIDNPNNLNEINHKDEDKSNNRVDNLEWCTKSYNVSYSKSKIIKIHNSIETIYNSVNEAAIKNNISASAIYNCLYGKSKTCGGYEWIKR